MVSCNRKELSYIRLAAASSMIVQTHTLVLLGPLVHKLFRGSQDCGVLEMLCGSLEETIHLDFRNLVLEAHPS